MRLHSHRVYIPPRNVLMLDQKSYKHHLENGTLVLLGELVDAPETTMNNYSLLHKDSDHVIRSLSITWGKVITHRKIGIVLRGYLQSTASDPICSALIEALPGTTNVYVESSPI